MIIINTPLLLFFVVTSPLTLADDFGLDQTLFNRLTEDLKNEGPKEAVFLKHLWPKIQEFFPSKVVIPAVEVKYKEHAKHPVKEEGQVGNQVETSDQKLKDDTAAQEDEGQKENEDNLQSNTKQEYTYEYAGESYSCQTETQIIMNLKELTENTKKSYEVVTDGLLRKKKGKLEVEAEINIEPMSFDVAVDTYDEGKPFEPFKMKYNFKGSNKVKINMFIPDLTKPFSAECLVTVTGIEATKFDEPDYRESDIKDDRLTHETAIHYLQEMERNGSFYEAMSTGIKKSFIEKIKEAKRNYGKFAFREKKTWICISDELKKNEADLNKRFSYSNKYKKFCGGKKVTEKNDKGVEMS